MIELVIGIGLVAWLLVGVVLGIVAGHMITRYRNGRR